MPATRTCVGALRRGGPQSPARPLSSAWCGWQVGLQCMVRMHGAGGGSAARPSCPAGTWRVSSLGRVCFQVREGVRPGTRVLASGWPVSLGAALCAWVRALGLDLPIGVGEGAWGEGFFATRPGLAAPGLARKSGLRGRAGWHRLATLAWVLHRWVSWVTRHLPFFWSGRESNKHGSLGSQCIDADYQPIIPRTFQ